MPLAREHGRDAALPHLLDSREQTHLVIHEDVVIRGVSRLDVLQLSLLVDVDEDAAPDGVEQSRAPDLVRLEYDVAVGEDDGRAPDLQMADHVERAWVEAVGERIVDEERGDREEVWVAGGFAPIALERAQIVRIAELGAQFLEDHPVAVLALRSPFRR